MKKNSILGGAICALSLLGSLTTGADAALVSVNFVGGGGAAGTLGSAEIAGVLAASNWNNVTTSGSALIDSTGLASAMTVTFSVGGWSNKFITATDSNSKLMKGYLDIGGTNTTTISINNLDPALTYQVYLYTDGENSNNDLPVSRTGAFTVNGLETGITDAGDANYSGTFTQVTAGTTGEGNYTMITLTGSSSYSIAARGTAAGADNVYRAPINALQVVSVPEPTAAALSALGLLAFVRRRRR